MISQNVLNEVRCQLIDTKKDTRYHLNAYAFILHGISFYSTKAGEARHYTGQELAHGFAEFAWKQFGLMAFKTLAHWGIKDTKDFGNIVYNLIAIKLMRKHETDRLEDFNDAINLKDYFKCQVKYIVNPLIIKAIKEA